MTLGGNPHFKYLIERAEKSNKIELLAIHVWVFLYFHSKNTLNPKECNSQLLSYLLIVGATKNIMDSKI